MTETSTDTGQARRVIEAAELSVRGTTAIARDQRELSLSLCAWAVTAPCGCMSGITMAATRGGKLVTSADAAMREVSGSPSRAAKDQRQGFRAHLIEFAMYRPTLLPLFVDCPHTPQWGVTK